MILAAGLQGCKVCAEQAEAVAVKVADTDWGNEEAFTIRLASIQIPP